MLCGVPVAVPYAGNHRGFHALPDVGVIVELCFAYALPHLPYIRSVLPINQQLPKVGENEAIWQHSQECYQKYNDQGDWQQVGRIHESRAQLNQIMKSPKTWVGSDQENVLKILSDFMDDTAAALDVLASHTHPSVGPVNEGGAVSAKSSSITEIKSVRLDPITE